MVVIENIDSQKFSFNGIEYFKNFTPIVVGNKIRILNTYDSSIELTDSPILYSDFEVDGNTFASVALLQTALLPILYTRNTLGGGGGYLSNVIGDYTDATTPLDGTELALIDDGTGFKKVAVSEFSGGGTTWDLSDLTKYSIYAWKPTPASWITSQQPTIVGTADNAAPIFTGTQVQKATRRRYVSSSTAGSSVDFYEGSFRQTCMGCGFFFSIKFAFEDAATVANARSFAGLFSSLAVFGNVNPSTQVNIFGVGADSGDTNLQLIHNNASGTATKVDLGANFPANTSATDEYLFQCYNLQGQTSSMWWRLINVTSMISTDWAEVTTDLPVSGSGTYINPRLWRNNGSTALAVRLAIMDMNLYKLL